MAAAAVPGRAIWPAAPKPPAESRRTNSEFQSKHWWPYGPVDDFSGRQKTAAPPPSKADPVPHRHLATRSNWAWQAGAAPSMASSDGPVSIPHPPGFRPAAHSHWRGWTAKFHFSIRRANVPTDHGETLKSSAARAPDAMPPVRRQALEEQKRAQLKASEPAGPAAPETHGKAKTARDVRCRCRHCRYCCRRHWRRAWANLCRAAGGKRSEQKESEFP